MQDNDKSREQLIEGLQDLRAQVTKGQQTEEALRDSERILAMAQEVASVGSWCWDIPTGALSWSDETCRHFGLEPGSIKPSYEMFESFVHPADLERLNNAVQLALEGKKDYSVEARMLSKDGTEWIMHAQGKVFRNESGKAVRFIGTQWDITKRKETENALRKAHCELENRVNERTAELKKANKKLQNEISDRKKAEEQVKASLQEKELLLREVHHRVKNNMQVINSLLKMQAVKSQNEELKKLIVESQNRIRSMSLIHEKLYQSDNFKNIDFKGYVKSLTISLFQANGLNPNDIKLEVNIDDIALDIENAIPCGLIINELVSNAMEHAFPKGNKGSIRVALKEIESDKLELIVADDGIGLPEELDIKNIKSMGLYLVTMLAERQLDGEVELNREVGTQYRIRFKKQEYKPRM